jgi:short-subunit dehydrogenase
MARSKNLVVFGAGVGVGASVAHRFGREGFRVGLVGRRQHRLDEVASDLQAAGIESAAFTADLARPKVAAELVREIEAVLGEIDVLYYGPLAGNQQFYPARSLDVPTQQGLLDLFFLTPMALIGEILPGMMARRAGTILVTQGLTAVDPIPGLSGLGPAMAAMHNFIRSLFGELAEHGVYAGTLTLRAGVRGSEMYQRLRPAGENQSSPPSVEPDDIAELLWTMYVSRDQPAMEYPVSNGPAPT